MFFPEKRMKETFAYVLEFMLTFDKMQNTSYFMRTKFEILKLFKLLILYA